METKPSLANCSECGILFVKYTRPVCRNCFMKDHKELMALSNFIEKNPNMPLDSVLEETSLTEKQFNKLLKYGKYWSFKNIDIKCRICNKPIPAVTGRMLCYKCLCEVAAQASSSKKIEKLREEMKLKKRQLKQYQKDKTPIPGKQRRYGFKNALKEYFASCVFSDEAELLPVIERSPPLRLSSSFGFARISVINV